MRRLPNAWTIAGLLCQVLFLVAMFFGPPFERVMLWLWIGVGLALNVAGVVVSRRRGY